MDLLTILATHPGVSALVILGYGYLVVSLHKLDLKVVKLEVRLAYLDPARRHPHRTE